MGTSLYLAWWLDGGGKGGSGCDALEDEGTAVVVVVVDESSWIAILYRDAAVGLEIVVMAMVVGVVDYDTSGLHALLCAWACPAARPVGSWAGSVSTWSRWMCKLFVWFLFSAIRPAVLFSGLSVLVPGSDGKQSPLPSLVAASASEGLAELYAPLAIYKYEQEARAVREGEEKTQAGQRRNASKSQSCYWCQCVDLPLVPRVAGLAPPTARLKSSMVFCAVSPRSKVECFDAHIMSLEGPSRAATAQPYLLPDPAGPKSSRHAWLWLGHRPATRGAAGNVVTCVARLG